LIDVVPTLDGKKITVYDISLYLPHWEGQDRHNYMKRVDHSVRGNKFTIHIIDHYGLLEYDQAVKFAGRWYVGNGTYTRLD